MGVLSTDQSEQKAAAMIVMLTSISIGHLLVVLFVGTKASVERIVATTALWLVAPLPFIAIIELGFRVVAKSL